VNTIDFPPTLNFTLKLFSWNKTRSIVSTIGSIWRLYCYTCCKQLNAL